MRDSVVKTIGLPQLGTEPATLVVASGLPMRLLVRNVGPVDVLLAHQSNEITGASALTATGVYQLAPGDADVFVLAPKQGLWGAGAGAGGRVCLALSEAVPSMKMES